MVSGVFLFDEFDHQSIHSDLLRNEPQVWLDPRVDASSRAVFGEATVGLTARFSVAGGISLHPRGEGHRERWGALQSRRSQRAGPWLDLRLCRFHCAWTPKVGLEWTLPDGALSYVSATRGFKSGGFNPWSRTPGRSYAPEWAWS